MTDSKSSRFDSIIDAILARGDPGLRIVVMGDVSGSMSIGNQMNILRLSFKLMLDNCHAHNCKISLASWNTTPEWCTKTWIDSRRADGSTYVLSALIECMLHYSNATDVIVMGDSDMTPFYIHQGSPRWEEFHGQYSATKFHFIALGLTASHASMETMALIENGIYKETT